MGMGAARDTATRRSGAGHGAVSRAAAMGRRGWPPPGGGPMSTPVFVATCAAPVGMAGAAPSAGPAFPVPGRRSPIVRCAGGPGRRPIGSPGPARAPRSVA
jgi:hypothetical protein